MSHQLINHSPDLKRLRDEGYEVQIKSGHLLISDVPYINSNREVKYGTLVSTLHLAGNVTTKPDTHVGMFKGDYPCHKDGSPIEGFRHASHNQTLAEGVEINHSFSSKPRDGFGYPNYYEKMKRYIDIISAPTGLSACTFRTIESVDSDSAFQYLDSWSSRAGISTINDNFKHKKIAIIGLGGTGSYVLDLVAKTPVSEIHLYDGDKFLQHNAFRAPGAASLEQLNAQSFKVDHFRSIYSNMHRNILAHSEYLNESNINELPDFDFVFICIDKGEIKKLLIAKLENDGTSFIDVGIGVQAINDALIATVRVTTSTQAKRDHLARKVSLDDRDDDEYAQNIQIADLNSLNASLAVIKWKKLCGFYHDHENEHHSTYTVDTNLYLSECENEN